MPQPLEHAAESRAPALRISHIVYGRQRMEDGRVVYHINETGPTGPKAIAETVVLKRWKKRIRPGWRFSGARISPNFWRAMKVAFPDIEAVCARGDVDALRLAIDAHRDELRKRKFSLPGAECVHVLLKTLGPNRARQLMDRHNDPRRADRYGTPDLLLYAERVEGGGAPYLRFVEVKKPREPLSSDQREEIVFLRGIGIPARVLRLIETPRER